MSLYCGYLVPNFSDPTGEGLWEGVIAAATSVVVAVVVAAGTALVVASAPLSVPALLVIGGIAAVTGFVSGSQMDGFGPAVGMGALNGLLIGATAGGGVVIEAMSLTVTQSVITMGAINVATANVQVFISGHAGEWKYHAAASITGMAFGVMGVGASVAERPLESIMWALDGELIISTVCPLLESFE